MFVRYAVLPIALAAAPSLALAQTTPAPAPSPSAQAAPAAATPTVGATVYDSTGAVMGTVDAVTPQAVVINLGSLKVPVPPTSIGPSAKGLAMAMTRADLEAAGRQAAAQSQAAASASLTNGTKVFASDGTTELGTVKQSDASTATIATAAGRDVKLPKAAFGAAPNGVAIGMTAQQFTTALDAAAPAPTPAASPTPQR